jgi:tetratricopeptide (TPR) repeat protein
MHLYRVLFFLSFFLAIFGIIDGADNLENSLLIKSIDFYQKGDYEASLKMVNDIISINETNGSALNLRGLINMKLGKHESAQKDFEKSLQYSSNHSQIYYNLGLNAYHSGNMIQADRYFSQAYEDNYSFFNFFYYAGVVKSELGQYDDAVSLLKNASRIHPHDPQAWIHLGIVYEQIRKFDLAVQAYDNAIISDPALPGPWMSKGKIFLSFGNISIARMAFENYTSLDPDDDIGWFYYAKSLHDDKMLNASIEALHQAIEIDPTNQIYSEHLKLYIDEKNSIELGAVSERLDDRFIILLLFIIGCMSIIIIYRK